MTDLGLGSDDEPTLELPVVTVPVAQAPCAPESGPLEVLERFCRALGRLLLCLVPVLVCASVLLVALSQVPWTALNDAVGHLHRQGGEVVGGGQLEPSPGPETTSTLAAPSTESEPENELRSETLAPAHPPPPPATPKPEPTRSQPDLTAVVREDLDPVDEAAIEQLRIGMTVAEVTAAIGVDGYDHWPGYDYGPITPTDPMHQRSVAAEPSRWDIRTWPEQHFGPVPVEVIFRDGLAVEINA